MGSGASSSANDVPAETVDYLKDTAMKPDDASDVKDLKQAKQEIVRLRALAKEHLQGTKLIPFSLQGIHSVRYGHS